MDKKFINNINNKVESNERLNIIKAKVFKVFPRGGALISFNLDGKKKTAFLSNYDADYNKGVKEVYFEKKDLEENKKGYMVSDWKKYSLEERESVTRELELVIAERIKKVNLEYTIKKLDIEEKKTIKKQRFLFSHEDFYDLEIPGIDIDKGDSVIQLAKEIAKIVKNVLKEKNHNGDIEVGTFIDDVFIDLISEIEVSEEKIEEASEFEKMWMDIYMPIIKSLGNKEIYGELYPGHPMSLSLDVLYQKIIDGEYTKKKLLSEIERIKKIRGEILESEDVKNLINKYQDSSIVFRRKVEQDKGYVGGGDQYSRWGRSTRRVKSHDESVAERVHAGVSKPKIFEAEYNVDIVLNSEEKKLLSIPLINDKVDEIIEKRISNKEKEAVDEIENVALQIFNGEKVRKEYKYTTSGGSYGRSYNYETSGYGDVVENVNPDDIKKLLKKDFNDSDLYEGITGLKIWEEVWQKIKSYNFDE